MATSQWSSYRSASSRPATSTDTLLDLAGVRPCGSRPGGRPQPDRRPEPGHRPESHEGPPLLVRLPALTAEDERGPQMTAGLGETRSVGEGVAEAVVQRGRHPPVRRRVGVRQRGLEGRLALVEAAAADEVVRQGLRDPAGVVGLAGRHGVRDDVDQLPAGSSSHTAASRQPVNDVPDGPGPVG
ncbi:hypothetical protein ACFQV4_00455 [Streptomyces thermocarboxydus]